MKQSKVITQPPKIIENPHIIDIKSVIIEHRYYRSKLHINYQIL